MLVIVNFTYQHIEVYLRSPLDCWLTQEFISRIESKVPSSAIKTYHLKLTAFVQSNWVSLKAGARNQHERVPFVLYLGQRGCLLCGCGIPWTLNPVMYFLNSFLIVHEEKSSEWLYSLNCTDFFVGFQLVTPKHNSLWKCGNKLRP